MISPTITNNSPFATNGANASGQYPQGIYEIEFKVEDGCGNKSYCEFSLTVTDLTCVDPTTRPAVYRGEVPCTEPGRYGFTVRVVPTHPDLATPMDLGRITLP